MSVSLSSISKFVSISLSLSLYIYIYKYIYIFEHDFMNINISQNVNENWQTAGWHFHQLYCYFPFTLKWTDGIFVIILDFCFND